MQVDAWLKAASHDAEKRGLPELRPLLETLARSTAALREADEAVESTQQALWRPTTSPADAGTEPE
jgi:hypothetical protein